MILRAKPRPGPHPEHRNRQRVAPGVFLPAIPVHPRGINGILARRTCRKRGGHWWHPVDPMIGWGCCACGALRDGMPDDGT